MTYLFKYNNQCLQQCPTGYFGLTGTSNVCTICNGGCLTCNLNAADCYSCTSNFYKDLESNTCNLNSCPSNQYID